MEIQDKLVLELSLNEKGEVSSFICQGKELASINPKSVFQVQMRDIIGNPFLLSGTDFKQVVIQKTADGFHWTFSGCQNLPGTVAKASVRIAGAASFWKITVVPGKKEYGVEWIEFPRICFRNAEHGKWLLPLAEGTMVESLLEREKTWYPCISAEYALRGISSFYPGPAAMPFEAYLTPETSLWFACPDSEHSPKSVDFLPDGPDAFYAYLQHFTGGQNSTSYETVIRAFQGDWTDAADFYRQWMESNDPSLPSKIKENPGWLKDSPVLLIYPVKGAGLDANSLEPNEYFPYSRALPMIRKYQEDFDCRILSLLMHWEGTAPWAPPYIWPPYGGEDQLKSFVDSMHSLGNLVGLYGSGIGWTQQSMIDPSYNREKDFAENHVKDEICIGPRGEAFSRVCNGPVGQRLGYDLCPGRAFTRKTVCGEIRSAAGIGVDYLQYFDQNQGCTSPMCYSKEHQHPALPGAWQTRAMQELLDQAQAVAGSTVIGCENAAAEPYMKVCRLNDMRSHLAWGMRGKPVPLYQYLFHEYASGFTGNGVCLGFFIDFEKTPFFLQWLLAWNFASGNLLAVVLKDAGKIHWSWIVPWSDPEPEQAPLKTLIRNLNQWRKGPAADYLVCGRMEKKPLVHCRTRTIFRKKGMPAEVPVIESSAWSSGNKHAVVLVNYNETPEKCQVVFEQESAGTVDFGKNKTVFRKQQLDLEIPPLNMILLTMEK